MLRRMSSPNQKFNAAQGSCREDSSLPAEDGLDVATSEFAFSGDVACEGEQLLAQLERIAVGQVRSQSVEQRPPTVPLLGHMVPGAESCAIFSSDSTKRKLYPIAVANLSRKFIYALANEDGEHLLAAARQAEPYVIINLPDNKRFEALGELSRREGIRTLWLVPLCEEDGSVFGTFLFASKEAFAPSREAIVSVTLLTVWMSAILRQASSRRPDCRFLADFDSGEAFGARIGDEFRIAAIDRLTRDLTSSRQDRTTDQGDGKTPAGGADTGATALRMYQDKHGIPVKYDAATHEQKKQTKSDAISVLSHELLSPLTLIKGYTATLLQLNDAITEAEKEQYLKGIDSASDRVIRLLENLQDIARLEETDAIYAEPVHFFDILRTIISEMQSQTNKHIIKLRPSARLPRVRVDPDRIEQVIRNLLINAIKYSPQGGDIEAEIQVVQSEQELRRMFPDAPVVKLPCLIVSVADSGIGIPEAELDNIFNRFYRVNSKLTRTTPGAGLGLYICNIIVEAHNGRIWARNRLQGGSIFSFSLPVELPK